MLEKKNNCSTISLHEKEKISIDETNDVLFIVSMWTKTDIHYDNCHDSCHVNKM